MAEENKTSTGNIVSKKDLGNGMKEVTFKLDASSLLDKYTQDLVGQDETIKIGKGSIMQRSTASNIRSRYYPSASDYFLEYFNSNDKPYSFALMTPIDPHDKIRLAIELYYKEPIIGNVIDMMVDFSASGFEIISEDIDIKNMFDEWARDVKLHELVEQIFLEYYRSGNVAIWRTSKDSKVTITKKSTGKKVSTKKTYKFPGGYTILNPMNVIVEGPLMFNQEVTYLQLSEDVVNTMQGWNGGDEVVQNMIPEPLLKDGVDGSGRIVLDSDHLTRILRKKQPYERYASPYLERVFEPVLYKQKLRQMDMSTIDGLVNQLVTVTIGNDEYPATDDDLEAVAELFQTPSKAYTIFWNHTLNVQFHEPQGMQALMADKYQQVNDDIYAGLGISRVLVDGNGGNFSSSWVSILSLVERLESGRQKVQHWIESEFKRVAEENGFDTVPKIRFDKMNLREDNYIRNILLAMYDRGLLDEEDVLRETGRDYNSILETKKRNEKNAEYFVPPVQPFQGQNDGTPFKSPVNDGKPSGQPNKKGYPERNSTPEQNSGNPPKPKGSSAYDRSIAYSTRLQEEYETELKDYYDTIQSSLSEQIDVHKKNKKMLEGIIAGILIGMFKSFSHIGAKYLDESYNHEVALYSDKPDVNAVNSVKKELLNWNDSYIHKLANDIKDDIVSQMSQGHSSDEAVTKAFKSNAYRVRLIAEAGIIDSTRQAKIQGNRFAGKSTATWVAHHDDKTCNVCSGLDGKSFGINTIPPRPHSGCRCDLNFN